MPVLHRRFERIKSVLNRRMADLTVLLEDIEKPHNLSAILRTCDAVGVLEAHAISTKEKTLTFNSTAQGSQKWVKINSYKNTDDAVMSLKKMGFKLYGTNLNKKSIDYRECDFTQPTAFVLGAEKWGLKKETTELMDNEIYIPMRGMVQSLNVSVAASILLFEALRQRQVAGITPNRGEGLSKNLFNQKKFEWAYPELANWYQTKQKEYPILNEEGEIKENLTLEKNEMQK